MICCGGAGYESLTGGAGDDIIYGQAGIDFLDGGAGDDTLVGGAGADTFLISEGNDRIVTDSSGLDTIVADVTNRQLRDVSRDGTDMLFSTADINGVVSTTRIVGAFGATPFQTITIREQGEADEIFTLQTSLFGGLGDDFIVGTSAGGLISGGDGRDVLFGGIGNDSINGGLGDDILFGGAGDDVLDGDAGIDEVSYETDTGAVTVDLSTTSATDGNGNTDDLYNIENVTGSRFDDDITGDSANNYLFGGDGDDILDGGLGDDIIEGGAGNDLLVGGGGADSLHGGTGNDSFIYTGSEQIVDGGVGDDAVAFAMNEVSLVDGMPSASYPTQTNDATDALREIEGIFLSELTDLYLDAEGVVKITDENNTLVIHEVDATTGVPHLTSVDAEGTWAYTGQESIDVEGIQDDYNVYTATVGGDTVTLKVDKDIDQASISNAAASINEPPIAGGGQATFPLEGLVITDNDDQGGVYTVTVEAVGVAALLTFDAGSTGVTLTNNGTSEVTLSGTLSAINAMLSATNGVIYGVNGQVGADSLEFTIVDDGGLYGFPRTVTNSVTVNLNYITTSTNVSPGNADWENAATWAHPGPDSSGTTGVLPTAAHHAYILNGTGSVTLDGAVSYEVGALSVGNAMIMSGGSVLTVRGELEFSFDGSYAGGNNPSVGNLLIDNATLAIDGFVDDELGVLYLTDGILEGAGAVAMSQIRLGYDGTSGDDFTIADLDLTIKDKSAATSRIEGTGTKTIDGGTVTVEGDLRLESGQENFFLDNGAAITVISGALLDLEDADGIHVGSGGGFLSIESGATLDRSSNTGDTAIDAVVDLNGTVTVQAGKLELTGGGTVAGAINVVASATMELSGSDGYVVDDTLNLTGTGRTLLDATTLDVGGAFTVSAGHTLTIGAGTTLTVADATMTNNGVISGEGTLVLAAGGDFINTGIIDPTGTLTVVGDIDLGASGGMTFDIASASTFDAISADSIDLDGGANVLNLNFGGSVNTGDSFDIITYNNVDGDLSDVFDGAPNITGLASNQYVEVNYTATGVSVTVFEDPTLSSTSPTGDLAVDGNEFTINSTLGGSQLEPEVVTLGNGKVVVVWDSSDTTSLGDADSGGIVGQIYNADGSPSGGEFLINSTTTGDSGLPSVGALTDGGFVVTWTQANGDGSGDAVFGRRFDSSGSAVNIDGTSSGSTDDFLINTATDGGQTTSNVDGLSSGGFVVTYTSGAAGIGGVAAKTYAADGTVANSEALVSNAGTFGETFALGLDNDRYAVLWRDTSDASGRNHYIRYYEADGTPTAGIQNITSGGGFIRSIKATQLEDGNVAVVYDLGNSTPYIQILSQTGTVILAETRVDNVLDANSNLVLGNHPAPNIVALSDGGFVVAYSDGVGPNYNGQRFTASGTHDGFPFLIGDTHSNQGLKAIDMAETGDGKLFTVRVNADNGIDVVGQLYDFPIAPIAYAEGEGAIVIDDGITITDPDSPDFDGGTLTVLISANATADDRLSILNIGISTGEIGFDGTNVTYEGTQIGTAAGGTDGSTPLVITLDADATPAATQALARAITYDNVAISLDTTPRTIAFEVTDGDGGTSAAQFRDVTLTLNDPPVVLGITGAVNSLQFDGEDDVISVADPSDFLTGAGAFTYEAWLKTSASGAFQQIIGVGEQSTGNGIEFTIDPSGSSQPA